MWLAREIRKHAELLKTSEILPLTFVFLALLLTAKVGEYVFLTIDTSPAVIWAPAGIAFAAVLLRGAHMWMAIAAAAFFAAVTSAGKPPFLVVLMATTGNALQPLLGAYLLRTWNFSRSFDTVRHVLAFTFAAMIMCATVATFVTAAHVIVGTLSDGAYFVWTRIWGGHMFSVLVLAPLFLTWLSRDKESHKAGLTDTTVAFGLLLGALYVLFWTSLGQTFSFPILVALFVALFWIALRLRFRAMTLAIFLMALIGMTGPIFSGVEHATPINQRLFSVELFVVMFGPIFFLFAALVKERRMALVTSTRRAHDLEVALRRLEESDRQKDEFISTLAHELRNPLGALLNSLELMQLQGLKAADSAESLSVAIRQTGQIDKMLRNLLDAARATQGKIELELESVDLSDLIDMAVETVGPSLKAGKQIFKVHKPQERLMIVCDPLRVEQILVNLLSNAIKYTDAGGRIALDAYSDSGEAVVSVTDTGKGISADMLEKIFDIFVQDSLALPIQGGLGIGLTLSRTLAELHGGSVVARSDGVGKGSTFVLRLPMRAHSHGT